jgi:hypothetical protein
LGNGWKGLYRYIGFLIGARARFESDGKFEGPFAPVLKTCRGKTAWRALDNSSYQAPEGLLSIPAQNYIPCGSTAVNSRMSGQLSSAIAAS